MITLKCYERTVSRRETINKFGKIGYVFYDEYFKTDREEFLESQNYCKKIKFCEVPCSYKFEDIEPDKVYEEELFRRNRKKYNRRYR